MATEKTAYSRRSVIAGIAGAVPAAAVGSVPALALPDAELIALGNELEALLRRYVPPLLRGSRSGWKAWDLSRERAGIANLPDGVFPTDEQYKLQDRELRFAEDETGFAADERILEPMYVEADRLMDAINALPATSEAGLRAKVLNACLTNLWMLWHDREGFDINSREMREMVIATCAVLGIALPDGFPIGGSEAERATS